MLTLIAALALGGAIDPKPFEFRGVVAGTDQPADQLKKCEIVEPEVRRCQRGFVPVAGASAFVVETYYRGRLTHIYINSSQQNWHALRMAFIAKYGEPCETTSREWRNAAGAVIPNPTDNWCFASGKLRLQRYGRRLSDTVASYNDTNQPPESVKVDF